MKKFVDDGMFLQTKITLIIDQNKNTFNYKNNWLLSLSLNKSGNDTQTLRKRSDFKQALSTLKRLHEEAGGDQLGPIPYCNYKQWRPASSSSSTWWQWQESWWSSSEFTESQEGRGKQRLVIDRGNPLLTELWRKPQTNGFQELILFCYS